MALRQRLFGRHNLKEEAGQNSVMSVICVILPLLFPSSSNIYRTYSWVCDIDKHVVILWIWRILCLLWGCKLHFLVWKYTSQSSLHKLCVRSHLIVESIQYACWTYRSFVIIFCNILGLFYCNFPLEVYVLCVLVVVSFWLMG